MEDHEILDLFFQRSEQAIVQTDAKYGGYCYSIAYNVLKNREDSQECVNDTYLAAWNTIPPSRPIIFSAFLAKVTRHLSIDRWRRLGARKRGGGTVEVALEELRDCTSSDTPENKLQQQEITRVLNTFLGSLPETERNVFLCRYWYLDPIQTIADRTGFSRSKVASMLHRTRGKLRIALEKEELL